MRSIQDITGFLDQPLSAHRSSFNEWVKIPRLRLQVYLRRSLRPIEGQIRQTLEVATIQVQERYRRKGFARTFYGEVEAEASKRGLTVFAENSTLPFMQARHQKAGYLPYEFAPDCFYLLPKPQPNEENGVKDEGK